jgi:hypothetical protein
MEGNIKAEMLYLALIKMLSGNDFLLLRGRIALNGT